MKSNQKTLPIAIEGRLFLYEVRNVARHAQSGKRVYGGVRMTMLLQCCSTQRLTSPDLRILCRMCTVDNKTFQPDVSF